MDMIIFIPLPIIDKIDMYQYIHVKPRFAILYKKLLIFATVKNLPGRT